MNLYDRAKQLRAKGKKNYMLWEAKPNPWHNNCYILDIECGSENFRTSVMTYFYTDGSGPTLAELVARHTHNHKSSGRAW